MKHIIVFTVLFCMITSGITYAKGQQIGEHLALKLETPHPYPGSATGKPLLVWSDHFEYPDANYIVFEFRKFDLAPGDWVEVRDPYGEQIHVYRGKGFKDKGGDFISKAVLGPEAIVDLYSVNPDPKHYGYQIDRVSRGFSDAELTRLYGGPDAKAICGTDDKLDAICFSDTYPDVYDKSRAVARILMDGSALCTAWLISCENHLITNNHCTWDDDDFNTQGELDRMEFQFMYQRPACGSGTASVEYSFMGGTWLEHDHNLDYTLIQAPEGEDPASVYGWLLIDYRLPDIDEQMFIVGHPQGYPKQISLESTHPQDQSGLCEVYTTDADPCVGGTLGEIGYYCDTEGGSSGSAVLSLDTLRVIALHHCANCPNRGVRIQAIWDHNQAGSHPLPPCSMNNFIGSVELDGDFFNCNDVIPIEVTDGSLLGAGMVTVHISSDTEQTPEAVTLAEVGPDSPVFTGTISTGTGSPVHGDGILAVADGDAITVEYIDADDGQGGVNIPRYDYATVDCIPPVISQVAVESTTGNSAVITWITDESAHSGVTYDTTIPPTAETAQNSELVTSHALELTGLDECQQYFFEVFSADAAGNTTTDTNNGNYYTFETGMNVNPTFSSEDTPLAIPDNNPAGVNSVITVVDNKEILDIDVLVNITHTYDGDISIYLVSPAGVSIDLSTRNGGSGEDYSDTVFDDEADTSITDGSAPFTGSFQPEEPLSTFDGIPSAGDWTLHVVDSAGSDVGTLNNWSITFLFPPHACGPHAKYAAHTVVHDACVIGGPGDNDGIWDAGEQVQFSLNLENDGNVPLSNVTAVVFPVSPNASMIHNTATFSDIPVDGTGQSNAPHFTVYLLESIACGETIHFQIDITSSEGTWTDTFDQMAGNLVHQTEMLLDENFDSGIPSDWTIVDGGSGGGSAATWTTTNPGNRPASPPIADPFAIVDSDEAGSSATQDEELISPVLNASQADHVTLSFDHYFRHYTDESAEVDIKSTGTGNFWTPLIEFTGHDSANPDHQVIDITNQAAGYDDVQIRFHYYSAQYEYYWMVDNITVQAVTNSCEMHACISGSPTCTPMFTLTATPTAIPTGTPIPSETPTSRPTPTPTAPPPRTPTQTPSPLPPSPTQIPTLTPTATQPPSCTTTGVTVWMPSHHFKPGDTCSCSVTVCNATEKNLTGYPLFVILDVLGEYFFAPSFSDYDNYLTLYPEFQPGETTITVIPEFPWPENAGTLDHVLWYAALTNPEITALFGSMDTWEFSWSN